MAHTFPSAQGPEHGADWTRGSGAETWHPPLPDSDGRPRPPTAAAASPTIPRHRGPFAWQNGSRLLLLESCLSSWTLAEFRFDAATCRYVELRRARYRWEREAAGALLSLVFAAGESTAEQTARDLAAWLAPERIGERGQATGGGADGRGIL